MLVCQRVVDIIAFKKPELTSFTIVDNCYKPLLLEYIGTMKTKLSYCFLGASVQEQTVF